MLVASSCRPSSDKATPKLSPTLHIHASGCGALSYSAVGLPNGLTIDATSGVVSGTIAAGAGNTGAFAPVVTVNDGTSTTSEGFNWSVASPLALTPLADQQSNEGQSVGVTVHASGG